MVALNQHELDGRALTVNLAKPREEHTPRLLVTPVSLWR
jgi:hypothetical protein